MVPRVARCRGCRRRSRLPKRFATRNYVTEIHVPPLPGLRIRSLGYPTAYALGYVVPSLTGLRIRSLGYPTAYALGYVVPSLTGLRIRSLGCPTVYALGYVVPPLTGLRIRLLGCPTVYALGYVVSSLTGLRTFPRIGVLRADLVPVMNRGQKCQGCARSKMSDMSRPRRARV